MSGRRVAIHGEDPGAMNLLGALPDALAAHGVGVDLFLDGAAERYARERGLDLAPYRCDLTPERLFGARPPDFVVVGTAENRRTRALALVALARAAGIDSAGVVDIPANAAHRFRGESDDPLAFAPDWILVPDPETSDAFAALGVRPERIVRIRNPRFEALLARRASRTAAPRPERWPADRPIVVFAAEPTSIVEPELSHRGPDYTLVGRGRSSWRTGIVLEELLDALATFAPRPHLVVRLHPKNERAELAPYANEIDDVSAGGDPLEVLLAADLVVGMSSMILQEAAILGTPVVSILPRAAERAWLPMLERGQIVSVTERATLVPTLRRFLAERPTVDLGGLDGVPLAAFILERLQSS